MDNIEKIKLNGVDYGVGGGDNIKTVEIKGVWNDGGYRIELDNIFIDISKNVRFELYSNNKIHTGFIIKEKEYTEFDYPTLSFYGIEDGAENIVEYTGIDSYIFELCFADFEKIANVYLSINALFWELNETDNVVIKLTYVEANELSKPYFYEL